jgi:hypothetical protein
LKEIILQKLSAFPDTIRADPDQWDKERLSLSWMLSPQGNGLAPRWENLAKDFFTKGHNSKDGWKYLQCNHQDVKEVLEFLVLLINPNKPKW